MTDVDGATAVSADGTTIGYRLIGAGPPLLVLHGSMQSALSQRDLATELADRFTVVLPDRRGRGASGPVGDWSLAREVEDVAAVRAVTGAASAVGVSSGALILLNAALAEPFERLVLFEPPLFPAGAAPAGLVEQLERELARGDVAAALVTGMRGAQMGPAALRALPRPLLQRMTTAMMDRAGGDLPSFRELAATLPYEFRIVTECAGTAERYRAVTAPTLLLGGGRSRRYLKNALSTLEGVLPDVRRAEIAGIDHGGTENVDRRGKPALVAAGMATFL
jgi:pimeloyl-ACP methyl ester carboxylesterase